MEDFVLLEAIDLLKKQPFDARRLYRGVMKLTFCLRYGLAVRRVFILEDDKKEFLH